MLIDFHTHVFHPKIADKVLHQLENHYSIHPVGTGTADDLLQRMSTSGIDKSVVLTAATAPAQVIPANNWGIQTSKEYDQFIPFGTVHPRFDQMERELDRLESNGIKGLKFHPDFQGFRMDDPALFDVMEMIQDRFICLFHVGDTLPPDENPSCPRKLAAIKAAFPETTIVAAHMGGYRHWKEAIEHLAGNGILVDTSSSLDFIDDRMLKELFDAFGIESLLFGSDYPLFDACNELDQLKKRLSLNEAAIDQIMSNASTLLNL